MSELVEQVARAISKAEYGDEGEWEFYTHEARAALSVLEPRIESLREALLWCSRHAGGEIADDASLAELKYVPEIVRLRIEALEREQGWQDIATAPKDGTPILLFARCKTATAPVILVGWHLPNEGWVESSFTGPVGVVPTHWRPLPPPPTGERG